MMQESTLNNKRILIVDDTPSIHEDFKKVLQTKQEKNDALEAIETKLFESQEETQAQINFELTSAFQGQEAINLVTQAQQNSLPFAMAFVDVRMPPGMDGIKTIKALWEIDPNIEVVICTAYSDYSWDDTIATLGQSDQLLILKKPFDVVEVMQLASSLVTKWNLARQAKLNKAELERLVKKRTDQLSKQTQRLSVSLKELKQTKVKLYQADKLASVGQLAAGLAHEINNPIGYVSCNLNSLQEYMEDIKKFLELQMHLDLSTLNADQIASYKKQLSQLQETIDLEFILDDISSLMKDSIEGVERVSRIVCDLTEFSHVNSTDQVSVNINELLEKTLSVAWNQLKNKVTVIRKLTEIPNIIANGGQLGQVFLNLIINASQAIDTQGSITLKTGQDESGIWIEIADTGKGIAKEDYDKVFDPFFTTKPVGEGTGLGLHIAHNIITQHQGTLDFTSTLGKGTCFRMELPFNQQQQVA